MPDPQFFTDNNQDQFQQAAATSEAGRASRLKQMSDALANEATAQQMTDSAAVANAYKGSYADALQPAAPSNISQDATGGGAENITDGQTQVQSVPVVSDAIKPPPSPIGSMQIPGAGQIPPVAMSAMNTAPVPPQRATSVTSPAAPMPSQADALQAYRTANNMPTPPVDTQRAAMGLPIGASTGAPAAPAPATTQAVQQPAAQANGTTPMQLPQASPFDSAQFQQNLAARLAALPGNLGAQQLMQIKSQRDATIGSVMQMIENGHSDEARFTAQRNGLNIPEQFYQNSDLAAGMNYASKAYPEDPDKGQAFFQSFMATPSTTPTAQRVQQAMADAGPPTSQGQKELNKALALGRGNYMTAGRGVVNLNPITHVATPYTEPTGAALSGVITGYGMHTPASAAARRFMNVGGQLVDTQQLDGQGRPSIVVPKNADPQSAIINLTNHIMAAGINVKPADAAAQAQAIYGTIHSANTPAAGSGIGAQTIPAAATGAPKPVTGLLSPALDTAEPQMPQQQPGAPVIPPGLAGLNLQYSPSTGLFRDKATGTVYDQSGNPQQ